MTTNTVFKNIYFCRTLLLLLLLLAVAPLTAKKIDATLYPKIGVLVCRMGNTMPISPMPQITTKTDYAARTPSNNVNIYIDDESRLKELLPQYPAYPGSSSSHTAYYYQNLTEPITAQLLQYFQQKGFTALDVRKLLGEKTLSIPGMTIQSILAECTGKVEAVFIMHYLDIGSFLVDQRGVKAGNVGFTSFLYGVSLFDVSDGKRLFYYSPLLPIAISNVFAFDESILNDPQFQGKITVTCGENNDPVQVKCDFTDAELAAHITRIAWNGFDCPKKPLSNCHKKMSCNPIKGIVSNFGGDEK